MILVLNQTPSNSFDGMLCRRLILGQLGWAPRLAAFFFFLGHQLRFGPEEFLPLRRGLSETLVRLVGWGGWLVGLRTDFKKHWYYIYIYIYKAMLLLLVLVRLRQPVTRTTTTTITSPQKMFHVHCLRNLLFPRKSPQPLPPPFSWPLLLPAQQKSANDRKPAALCLVSWATLMQKIGPKKKTWFVIWGE